MKISSFKTISVIFLIPAFLSCSRDCPCLKGNLYFGLINFNENEADTIIIRRFGKNSNFSVPIDTIPLYNLSFTRFTDTLYLSYFPETAQLNSNHDYELFFPGVPKLIRISEINEIVSEQKCNGPLAREKVDCVNEITSYKINGQLKQPSSLLRIFLDK
jgi:hypothetical protein